MSAKPRLAAEQICAQACATYSLKGLRKRADSTIIGIKGWTIVQAKVKSLTVDQWKFSVKSICKRNLPPFSFCRFCSSHN